MEEREGDSTCDLWQALQPCPIYNLYDLSPEPTDPLRHHADIAKELYRPIPIQGWQTRVIHLQPGQPDAPLECDLLVADIILFKGLALLPSWTPDYCRVLFFRDVPPSGAKFSLQDLKDYGVVKLQGHQLCLIEEFSEASIWVPSGLRALGAVEPFDRNMYAGRDVWEACFAVTNNVEDGDVVIIFSEPAGYPLAATAIKKGGPEERTQNPFFEDVFRTNEVLIVLRPLGTFKWNTGTWVMHGRSPSRFHQQVFTII